MKKEQILNFLKGAGKFSEEILVFLVGGSGYGGISGGLQAVSQLRRERARQNPSEEFLKQERKRVSRLIQMLKSDGLIASNQKQGRLVQYQITKAGQDWLKDHAKNNSYPMPKGEYPKEKSDTATIVTYDIPQSQRRLRDWLRGELSGLGLTMLQRSVFVGKVKIPKEFIEDLSRMHLIDYVEIFEITKQGTLRSRK